jgi:hypothetical protein
MIVALIALFAAVLIVMRPISLVYMLLLYMLVNGLVSRATSQGFYLTVGSVNIFLLDFLFVMMILLLPIGLIKKNILGSSREMRIATTWIMLFLVYHAVRFLVGFYNQVPTDALARLLYSDFQAVYFFLPLMFVKTERQLRLLLLAVVVFSLIYLFGQILLASREDALSQLKGAGTYRLGFGDSAIPVGIGLLALYIWERRLWLMVLPAVSIILIAHRSAYIAIFVALIMVAKYKGEKIKIFAVMVAGGLLTGLLLISMQFFTGEAVFDTGINRLSDTFVSTKTTTARQEAIPFMLGKWAENPVLGLGYKSLYELRETDGVWQEGGKFLNAGNFTILHPHNFVTRALVHYGSIGSLLLFTVIGYSLFTAKKLVTNNRFKKVGIFLLTSQVYFLIFAAMNTSLASAGFFYWILVGCTFWYTRYAGITGASSANNSQIFPEQSRGLLLSKTGKAQ